MVRFVLGVLVGVAMTLLLVKLQEPAPALTKVLAGSPRSEVGPTGDMPAPQVADVARAPLPVEGPASKSSGSNFPASAAQVVGVPQPVRSAQAPQSTAEHRDMAMGVSVPLPPSLAELHKRLESEQRDQSWSAATEQIIRQYLAQQVTSPEFDVAAVECRQTLCEVQVFGYSKEAVDKWSQVAAGLQGQLAASRFGGTTTSVAEKNGKTVLLSILYGRQP